MRWLNSSVFTFSLFWEETSHISFISEVGVCGDNEDASLKKEKWKDESDVKDIYVT